MPQPGQMLGDRYRLDDRIAAGGMGEVWQATDTVLGRDVAVKTLHDDRAGDPGFQNRFRHEARAMAVLHHPGVADVYDYGQTGADAYIVMARVQGEALNQRIAEKGRLTPVETLSIVAQAGRALEAAHQAGIVHRDVKPSNLIVRPDGTVVLVDFGVARSAESAALTGAKEVVGTALYIAPEQISKQTTGPSADVYALGAVAYHCLTGHPPFMGPNPLAVALQHLQDAPPDLPAEVPSPVRDLVATALAKNPSDRFPSAAAMADAADTARRSLSGPIDSTAALAAVPAARNGVPAFRPGTSRVPGATPLAATAVDMPFSSGTGSPAAASGPLTADAALDVPIGAGTEAAPAGSTVAAAPGSAAVGTTAPADPATGAPGETAAGQTPAADQTLASQTAAADHTSADQTAAGGTAAAAAGGAAIAGGFAGFAPGRASAGGTPLTTPTSAGPASAALSSDGPTSAGTAPGTRPDAASGETSVRPGTAAGETSVIGNARPGSGSAADGKSPTDRRRLFLLLGGGALALAAAGTALALTLPNHDTPGSGSSPSVAPTHATTTHTAAPQHTSTRGHATTAPATAAATSTTRPAATKTSTPEPSTTTTKAPTTAPTTEPTTASTTTDGTDPTGTGAAATPTS